MLVPARLALALQADGWYVRSDIIWAKRAPMPESCIDRPTSAHEHVFLLTKSARYFYDAEAVKEEADGNTHSRGSKLDPPMEHAGIGHIGWTRGTAERVSGRNLRNVLHLGPAPFPEAHFATFHPRIPEIAILAGTSAKGCCPQCGAGWVRVTERKRHGITTSPHYQSVACGDVISGGTQASTLGHGGKFVAETETLGWRASCSCDAGDPVPATCLDPFAGSGTSLLVADRLGRDAIGIELSEEYVAMARRRLAKDAPLLTEIAPE